MSDATTKRMIAAYMEEATAPMFLSGFFQSPPQNFHNTEQVEIDIDRDEEDVAIVVTDLKSGRRTNDLNPYTNRAFTPPIFDEEAVVTAYDMIKRTPGSDPFQNPEFQATAMAEAAKAFRRLERKIRRAVEQMASQVLQTGTLTLLDADGNTAFTMDFGLKATHLATASATWGGGSEDKVTDISDLAEVIRQDGKLDPTRLIFGKTAWREFIADTEIQNRLDNRSMMIGVNAPETRGQGATFQGFIWLGNYRYEMWTYNGFFKDPATGTLTRYVNDDNVIIMSEGARLDLSFGAIPMIRPPEERALPFLPPRLSDGGVGLDLTTNAWFTPDGKHLMVSAGTRPLTIPTAIDTYAVLDTTV